MQVENRTVTTGENTDSQTQEFEIIFTGAGISLPVLRRTIENSEFLATSRVARSGDQYIVTTTLAAGAEFFAVLDELADALGGRVSGRTAGNGRYAVIRIERQRNQSVAARTLSRFRGGNARPSQATRPWQPDQSSLTSPMPLQAPPPTSDASNVAPILRQANGDSDDTRIPVSSLIFPFLLALRLVGSSLRLSFIALATGLAIVFEPFTESGNDGFQNEAEEQGDNPPSGDPD